MNIKQLENQLLDLNSEIKNILDTTHYKNDFALSEISYDALNQNECMLIEEFRSLFTHLDYIDSILTYLSSPVIEEGILDFVGNGNHVLNRIELFPHDVIEILIVDKETNLTRWCPITLRTTSNYGGCTARIRKYKK